MRFSRITSSFVAVIVAAWLSTVFVVASVATETPASTYCVTAYGAVADGKTLDTASLQKAIDACAGGGGGTVHFPAGTYLTGTLFLRDRVTLHLDAGSVILGSTDLKDYPSRTPAFRSYTDVNYVDKSLIYAEGVHDATIVGRGVIDGQGGATAFLKQPYKKRPFLIRMIECKNVALRDITLRNSPMWVQHYLGCENLLIDGITVHSLVNKNNDGIDIDSCDRVRIANCDIVAEDDAIVLKSTTPRPCRRVTITNCTLSSQCQALKLGTESVGGFEDITISNCVVYDTRLSGIALESVDGGKLERVLITNITMVNTRSAIFIRLGNRGRPYLATQTRGSRGPFIADEEGLARPGVGSLRDVVISNVTATGVDTTGCAIAGLASHPLENITLRNIRITFAGGGGPELVDRTVPEEEESYPNYTMFGALPAYGLWCRHARNIRFENVWLDYEQPEHRPALVCDDVDGLRLHGFEAKKPVDGDTIRLIDVLDLRDEKNRQEVENTNRGKGPVAEPSTPTAIEEVVAPFEMPRLDRPVFPGRTFDIRKYGAKSDGVTKNTESIERAIEACFAAGGGRVLIPAGKWLTGAIHLKSNVNLHLAESAELHFSDDPDDYLPVVFTRWAGFEVYNYSPLVYARDCRNIAVTGAGKMFGHGKAWWSWRGASEAASRIHHEQVLKGVPPELRIQGTPDSGLRPQFISPINCTNVLLEGFSIESPGPFWTVNLVYCENVIVRDLNLHTVGGPNTDGINIDSSRNVLVEHCRIDAGDDCVALKSGVNEDGWRVARPTENVVIRHVTCYRGHGGIAIGSEMSGGVRNVLARDCSFVGTDRGIRMKANASRGGVVENIWFEDIDMKNIRHEAIQINTRYGAYMADKNGESPPVFRDITIDNVNCDGAAAALRMEATARKPIENVTLRRVSVTARDGMKFTWVNNLRLESVAVQASQGRPFAFVDCKAVVQE